jgi:hypothetical protein
MELVSKPPDGKNKYKKIANSLSLSQAQMMGYSQTFKF